MTESTSARRKAAFAVGTFAAVTLSCLLLVEAVLWAYAGVAQNPLANALNTDPYDVLVEPHGEAGYRPRPGRVFRYDNGSSAQVNAMGFRGPEVSIPKPDGTFRVVMLGGSTTFGWGVNDQETIDRHMSRLLAERYPGHRIEVVNLAFDGYDSYQLLERLRSDGLRFEPDAIIVNSGVNDVSHAWLRDIVDGDRRNLLYRNILDELRAEQARGGPSLWTRAKHWLRVARLPGWIVHQIGLATARRTAQDAPPPVQYWDFLDYFDRNLQRLAEVGTAGGATVLLSTPPSALLRLYEPEQPPLRHYWVENAATTQVLRDSLSARMGRLVEERAEHGVILVRHDSIPASEFLDDAHLTNDGNRRIAAQFVDALTPLIEAWARGHRP